LNATAVSSKMSLSPETLKCSKSLKLQLAFALALVKQKPPDKQVKEYILDIRKFIKNAKSDIFEPDKFFDSVGFWQNAYESSEAEQAKLLNTVFELEQKNQGLLAKIRAEAKASHGTDLVPSDWKTLDIDATFPSLRATREGLGSQRQQVGDQTGTESAKSLWQTDPQERGTSRLMRQIHRLQHSLQQRRCNPKSISMEAVILCKEAEWELLEAVQRQTGSAHQQPISSAKSTKQPDFRSVTRALELSFILVHQALRKVAGVKSGEQSKSQITYYLVCLFESTMTALTQHCTAISTQKCQGSAKSTDNKSSGRTKRSKSGKTQVIQSRPEAEDEETQYLTNLLCTMAFSMDLTRPEDQPVMEGYLYLALSRMGKILALFVFKDLRYPAEISTRLDLPAGLEAMNQEALTPQRAQREANHLMLFLSRVLDRRTSLLSETTLARSHFVRLERDRLQKTLVQAIFGPENPLFQGGLVRPTTPPAQDYGNQRADQPGFPEWFTQELWHLIGWELLGSTA
ncbi:uncharacterized protein N7459_003163, partial [Penicillium hispanicum]|uniref:uncharacterized protein n=1 Tax=Penicillium hispanicum TaxID=1080232 RepID=UPI00253FFA40